MWCACALQVERQLTLFADTLDEWIAVQKSWMYLEPIFSAVRPHSVDQGWRGGPPLHLLNSDAWRRCGGGMSGAVPGGACSALTRAGCVCACACVCVPPGGHPAPAACGGQGLFPGGQAAARGEAEAEGEGRRELGLGGGRERRRGSQGMLYWQAQSGRGGALQGGGAPLLRLGPCHRSCARPRTGPTRCWRPRCRVGQGRAAARARDPCRGPHGPPALVSADNAAPHSPTPRALWPQACWRRSKRPMRRWRRSRRTWRTTWRPSAWPSRAFTSCPTRSCSRSWRRPRTCRPCSRTSASASTASAAWTLATTPSQSTSWPCSPPRASACRWARTPRCGAGHPLARLARCLPCCTHAVRAGRRMCAVPVCAARHVRV